MLKRWRDREVRTPETPGVLPTEDRLWSYRYTEKDDNAERQSRVEARYVVTGGDGEDYNVTELITGRTVTLGRGENTVTVDRAVAKLMDMAGWVSEIIHPRVHRELVLIWWSILVKLPTIQLTLFLLRLRLTVLLGIL